MKFLIWLITPLPPKQCFWLWLIGGLLFIVPTFCVELIYHAYGSAFVQLLPLSVCIHSIVVNWKYRWTNNPQKNPADHITDRVSSFS